MTVQTRAEGLLLMASSLEVETNHWPKPLPGLPHLYLFCASLAQSHRVNNMKQGEWVLLCPLLSNLDIPASSPGTLGNVAKESD